MSLVGSGPADAVEDQYLVWVFLDRAKTARLQAPSSANKTHLAASYFLPKSSRLIHPPFAQSLIGQISNL